MELPGCLACVHILNHDEDEESLTNPSSSKEVSVSLHLYVNCRSFLPNITIANCFQDAVAHMIEGETPFTSTIGPLLLSNTNDPTRNPQCRPGRPQDHGHLRWYWHFHRRHLPHRPSLRRRQHRRGHQLSRRTSATDPYPRHEQHCRCHLPSHVRTSQLHIDRDLSCCM